MKHRALNYFLGDRLSFASRKFDNSTCIIGWGKKGNTKKARRIAAENNLPYFSLEDGFIRSVGLGIKGAPSFSLVVDNCGIYYDATRPSKLENILCTHDFEGNRDLMVKADQAIMLIRQYNISKYNIANEDITTTNIADTPGKNILVIAQTLGDMSLEFGSGNKFSTRQIIDAALDENPGAKVYLKIHPDVIAGKKKSDLNINNVPSSCRVITQDVNPISLLKKFDKVYTKTSQMGFEALLLGKECVCFGLPFYAGWGLTDDRVTCSRRKRKLTVQQVFAGAYILYSCYYNPHLNRESDIIDTLYTIKRYREIEHVNGYVLLLHGFPAWKRFCHLHFFKSYQRNALIFCSTPKKINTETKRKNRNLKLLVWSKPDDSDLNKAATKNNLETYHVEDGFIRSVSLGSDLTTPYSLVVDSRGLYFDPSTESDLEHIYNTYDFPSHTGLLERARKIGKNIVKSKLSKYNNAPHGVLDIDRSTSDKVILIPGQVADDASIRLGGLGMTNRSLIERVRNHNPDSYIIYKPHPDVVAGNRKGNVPPHIVQKYCNLTITNISIDTCINSVDEVHTITSLSGFDAILRDKKVVTYGMPFYAGWGLTTDSRTCPRRARMLTKEELIAGALLLYPRYIHPVTKELCEIELVLEEIKKEQERYKKHPAYRRAKEFRNRTLTTSRKLISQLK
ncbi:capsular polysaccharide biosynthesis protein [Desulfosediminicola flagellatus]|uniref:capsular polysaccharide biosynthesis protein n=1 Tax=Desulfosediminicola flagellatus TaxID=2569541 RepID=UPI00142ED3CE|nr:capsular polysaccharide biosynthesis protein [Desulfosediminicola flagellatus]